MHIAFPMGKKYEGVKIVAYIFWTSTMLTPHEKGGDNVIVFFQDYHVQLCLFISSRDTPRSLVLQNKCLSVSSFIHTYSDASNDPEKFFIHELFMNSHLHQHTVLKRILMCVLSPSLPKHQALRCKNSPAARLSRNVPRADHEQSSWNASSAWDATGTAIYRKQDCNIL